MSKMEYKRKKDIQNLVILVCITFLIGIAGLIFYLTRDKDEFITYQENSDVDYVVHLKDNDFYKEDYIEKDKGYIASLIDKISADFTYNVDFNKDFTYQYSYRVIADIDVSDDMEKTSLYHYSEDIMKSGLHENTGDLFIEELVDINYGKYNSLISKFKEVYDLNHTTSHLNVFLEVTLQDLNQDNEKKLIDKKVSTLIIPLTEKTISIDIGNDLISNITNKLEIIRTYNYTWVLVLSIFYLLIGVIYIGYIIIYSLRTRTAQMVYNKEIKSIMSNYDGYIQRISGSYDIGTCQVLKIESFNDMLEIRDTLKQPILMLENEKRDGTFFIIPATNSIIYTYALRVDDIKAKMDGREIPTYDITEIAPKDFLKKKKYTNEFIQEQITMTSMLPKIDVENVIPGNKDKEQNLYHQLEQTRSFDIKKIRNAEKRMKKNAKNANKKKKKFQVEENDD